MTRPAVGADGGRLPPRPAGCPRGYFRNEEAPGVLNGCD
jgi:hypothetical protein